MYMTKHKVREKQVSDDNLVGNRQVLCNIWFLKYHLSYILTFIIYIYIYKVRARARARARDRARAYNCLLQFGITNYISIPHPQD